MAERQVKPTCVYEPRPFQPCGKVATYREFCFGTPWCDEHAHMKERQFDLKVVKIHIKRRKKLTVG